MNYQILLYYKYVTIEYPERIRKWQLKLCQDLGLRGRILIAQEGINATVGGTLEALDQYQNNMKKHPLFTGIDFKQSQGHPESFHRLQVVIKKQIVNFGIEPTQATADQGGTHLSPEKAHQLMATAPDDLVVFDARNAVEWRIGRFKQAITPDINKFRDLPHFIDSNLDLFKGKQVLMNCTGGIRCERASSYLKSKGVAKEVYQLSGGIHRYIEQYPEGFFRGKNYVFDGRIAIKANDDILGACAVCATACDDYTNCLNALCNKHFIACPSCYTQLESTCSATCKNLIDTEQAPRRPMRKKLSLLPNEDN